MPGSLSSRLSVADSHLPADLSALLPAIEKHLHQLQWLLTEHDEHQVDLTPSWMWLVGSHTCAIDAAIYLAEQLVRCQPRQKIAARRTSELRAAFDIGLARLNKEGSYEAWMKVIATTSGVEKKALRRLAGYLCPAQSDYVLDKEITAVKARVKSLWEQKKSPLTIVHQKRARIAFKELPRSMRKKFARPQYWRIKTEDQDVLWNTMSFCADAALRRTMWERSNLEVDYEVLEAEVRKLLSLQRDYARALHHQSSYEYASFPGRVGISTIKCLLKREIRSAWKNLSLEHKLPGTLHEIAPLAPIDNGEEIYNHDKILRNALRFIPTWFGWQIVKVNIGFPLSYVDIKRSTCSGEQRGRIFVAADTETDAISLNPPFAWGGSETRKAVTHTFIHWSYERGQVLTAADVNNLCHEIGHAMHFVSLKSYSPYDDDRNLGTQFIEFPSVLVEKLMSRHAFRRLITEDEFPMVKTLYQKINYVYIMLDALWDVVLHDKIVPMHPLKLRSKLAAELGVPDPGYALPPGFVVGEAMGVYEGAYHSYFVADLLVRRLDEFIPTNPQKIRSLITLRRDVLSMSGPSKFHDVWKTTFGETVHATCQNQAKMDAIGWCRQLKVLKQRERLR